VSQIEREAPAGLARPVAESGRSARVLRRALAVGAFAALTAVGARIAVPLPGTVVPFTFQVVAVLLAGLVLGPRLGVASQAAYLVAGVSGLPVFAAGGGAAYLLGPTGGYLLAFPIAAALAGLGAERAGLGWKALFCALGIVAIHAGGIAWLGLVAGAGTALAALEPFAISDVLKLILVLLIGTRLRPRVGRFLA